MCKYEIIKIYGESSNRHKVKKGPYEIRVSTSAGDAVIGRDYRENGTAGFRLVGRSEKWGIIMINDVEGMLFPANYSLNRSIENTIIDHVAAHRFLLSALRPEFKFMKRSRARKFIPLLAGLMFHVKHYRHFSPDIYDIHYDVLSKWFYECGGTDYRFSLIRRYGDGDLQQIKEMN